jgi:tetratricopeptide (TPR) repeat protein
VVTCVLAALLQAATGCGARKFVWSPASGERLNEDKQAAHALLTSERYEAAAGILAPWAEREVQDPQVFSLLAKAQWKLGKYDDAVRNYEAALRLDYSDGYAHLELAQLLMETGRQGRALTEFELAVQYGEDDPLPHYNYGLALYNLDRKGEALAQWERAYSLDNNDPRFAEAMGMILTGTDDAAALTYFERAKRLGADRPDFHRNLGLLLRRLGRYTEAEAEFREALAAEPENVEYRRNLALLCMVSHRFSEAVPLWERLLAGDPDDRTYRIYLARAYLGLGRFVSTIDILEEWISTPGAIDTTRTYPPGTTLGDAPRFDEAYEVLAMGYRSAGNLERAAWYMRKALDSDPDNVVYLNNYGVILAEDDKIAEAKAQWRKALRIDPKNATAKLNLSTYEK